MLSVICVVTRCPPHSSFDAKAVSLFFDLISQDLAVSEPADEARHYFLHSYPVTQLYSLQALFKFCASHRDAIQTIRSGGLLSKAFSSGFYLPVKDSSQPQPQLSQLQIAVVELVRGLATSNFPEAQPTNVYECDLLLKLAHEHRGTMPSLVADVGQCLAWMLETAPIVTRRSFTELNVVTDLRTLIVQQEGMAKGGADVPDNALARVQVFRVCTTYLSADGARLETLCEPGMGLLDALFSLLRRPDCRTFAVDCITGCMLPRPNSDEGHVAKAALFSRFATQFSSILGNQAEEDPLQLVDILLKGVSRVVVRGSSLLHQDMFREAMLFLHIITFWNTTLEYGSEGDTMSELTVTLVQTLTALIAHNDDSKVFFSETIGYDQLQELLLRPGQVSDKLFMSMYSMMFDEVADVADSAKIQNAECVAMYVNLLYTREAEYATLRVSELITVLNGSSTNIQSCCEIGLLDLLIEKLPNLGSVDLQRTSLKFIEVLGGHSITAKQLRKFLSLMNQVEGHDSETQPSYASLLLETMHGMYVEAGAANFFDFVSLKRHPNPL
jgi:hypothetical protein